MSITAASLSIFRTRRSTLTPKASTARPPRSSTPSAFRSVARSTFLTSTTVTTRPSSLRTTRATAVVPQFCSSSRYPPRTTAQVISRTLVDLRFQLRGLALRQRPSWPTIRCRIFPASPAPATSTTRTFSLLPQVPTEPTSASTRRSTPSSLPTRVSAERTSHQTMRIRFYPTMWTPYITAVCLYLTPIPSHPGC